MTMTSKSIEKSSSELEIKAEKEGDIRRFQCDGSVTALLSKLRDMYKLGTDFEIKFKDDEGELVTIANDKDLATAVRICGPKLRIVVKAAATRPDPFADPFADVHLALGELSSGDEDEHIEDEEEPSVQPDIEALNPDMPSVNAIHARGGWRRGRGRGHACGQARGRGHHRDRDHYRDRHGQHGHDERHGHHEHHERNHHDHDRLDDVNEHHHHKGRARGGRGRGGRSRRCADKEEPYFPLQRKMLARIVKHVTLPDGAKVDPGAALKKTWRLRNDSPAAWPESCEIICVGGDMILGNTMPGVVRVRGGVLAGQETDVSVDLVAPAEPGLYQAYFRLKEVDGRKFGQRIWLSINVTAGTSESDEFVEVPAHGRDDGTVTSPNESNDYEMAIEKLREMGFTDDSVPRLVHRYRGNVERVAHRLIRKAK